MTSFEGKVITLTGAASGIGLATAHLLASRGASISVADVRQEPLDAAVAEIKDSSPNVKIYAKAVNVKSSQEVNDWLDETIQHLGPLNGAVNLAGVIGPNKQIVDMKDEDWDSVLDVNLKGVFNCIRAELQRVDDGASIVNASSIAGLTGARGRSAYSTSKHAVIGLTRSAAKEGGPRNIRVNCIAPGPIATPMLAEIQAQSGPEVGSAGSDPLCLKRQGQPGEMAGLIAFLLGGESSYTTGACYVADGGWTA